MANIFRMCYYIVDIFITYNFYLSATASKRSTVKVSQQKAAIFTKQRKNESLLLTATDMIAHNLINIQFYC